MVKRVIIELGGWGLASVLYYERKETREMRARFEIGEKVMKGSFRLDWSTTRHCTTVIENSLVYNQFTERELGFNVVSRACAFKFFESVNADTSAARFPRSMPEMKRSA